MKKSTEGRALTRRIASFFSLLATAMTCASWLKRNVEMAVVRCPMVFMGLGCAAKDAPSSCWKESEPYIFTRPVFDLRAAH
jgi:hypothetical protein